MAAANQLPTVDLEAGLLAFEEDLPKVLSVLEAPSLETLGWSRPSKLALLIPFKGTYQNSEDRYLLKLGFQAYRKWPPSAQFVNPSTQTFVHSQDQRFIPKLTAPGCHTHASYAYGNGKQIQLICCSATLEFYHVLHHVEPEHVWREADTFLTTIEAIKIAFTSFYQGRF